MTEMQAELTQEELQTQELQRQAMLQKTQTIGLLASTQNDLSEAFQAFGRRVKEESKKGTLSIADEAAALTSRVGAAEFIVKLHGAIVEVSQQITPQIAPPARVSGPGRGSTSDPGSGTGQYL